MYIMEETVCIRRFKCFRPFNMNLSVFCILSGINKIINLVSL